MDEKITFSQLCNMVALRSKMSRTVTEDFLRELFSMVSQSLAEGDTVKLKGIGTFKVQRVGVRKSVDVTSGREIIIPEHSKITFTPAKELATAVNAPFEAFEAVEISDEISDDEMDEDILSEQAELQSVQDELPVGVQIEQVNAEEESEPEQEVEVKQEPEPEDANDVNAESEPESAEDSNPTDEPEPDVNIFEKLVATPQEETSEPEVAEEQKAAEVEQTEVHDEPEVAEENPIAEVAEPTEQIESADSADEAHDAEVEEEVAEETVDDSSVGVEAPVADEVADSEESGDDEEYPKTRSRIWIIILSAVATIACLFIMVLLLCPNIYTSLTGSCAAAKTEVVESSSAAVAEENIAEDIADEAVTEDSAEAPNPVADAEKEKLMPETTPSDEAVKADAVVYDTITKTRYLTTMAKEHYGNFNFWPYIYKENEAFLGHPDRIKPGTQVVVPPLSKYGVDPKNPKDVAEARRLGVEIYKKYKK